MEITYSSFSVSIVIEAFNLLRPEHKQYLFYTLYIFWGMNKTIMR